MLIKSKLSREGPIRWARTQEFDLSITTRWPQVDRDHQNPHTGAWKEGEQHTPGQFAQRPEYLQAVEVEVTDADCSHRRIARIAGSVQSPESLSDGFKQNPRPDSEPGDPLPPQTRPVPERRVDRKDKEKLRQFCSLRAGLTRRATEPE
ncbi:hypothetical protein UVI_02040090 [Ustilaginoidea virens]|uniref:Uncharacterized protein n=1 Tax=Ustilaginoidea virens TaxID=1159556 RepID=A0A1B5KYN5_USTVR|nr:hypothetical protein UVI_02040090 [Ustilaginoidea virens]